MKSEHQQNTSHTARAILLCREVTIVQIIHQHGAIRPGFIVQTGPKGIAGKLLRKKIFVALCRPNWLRLLSHMGSNGRSAVSFQTAFFRGRWCRSPNETRESGRKRREQSPPPPQLTPGVCLYVCVSKCVSVLFCGWQCAREFRLASCYHAIAIRNFFNNACNRNWIDHHKPYMTTTRPM